MSQGFFSFEQRIQRVAARHPEMPQGEVVLTRLFFFVFKSLDDYFNLALAPYGLTTTTYLALVMIYASEDNAVNPSQLSAALVSSRPSATRLADELVKNGWVKRRPCTEDRRRVDLSLTAAGRALVEKVLPAQWRRVKALWSGFNEEERSTLERLLRKLAGEIERSHAR